MIKAIGFLGGQFGDAVMTTVSCKAFKETYPNSHLTFALSHKYKDILPLFYHNKYIDSYYIWEEYDQWPSEKDREFLLNNKYNIIYNPTPDHFDIDWYNKRHYCAETCLMHGLKPPKDLSCYLNPWFVKDLKYQNSIVISAFPSKSTQLNKTLELNNWNKIVYYLNNLGYECIQLGGKFDLQIDGAKKPDLSFIETAQILYSSKLHITCDTSWAWIGSAYQCKTIGIYGCHYSDENNIQNHLPINPNAVYITDFDLKKINLEKIFDNINLVIHNND
jgi:ADP-heptose:LPS heptosyltransferase